MANLRILYKNIADNASSISALTAASADMDYDKLLTEIKTEVFRSTNTSPTITYNWGTDQSINCVVLPCTNLSESATIRIKLYDSLNNLLYDSTAVDAVLSTHIYSGPLTYNVNLFSFGFYSKTAHWIPTLYSTVRKMEIILSDPSNPAGYIDCSRVLAGEYWEPTYNVDKGLQLSTLDESITSRTNAGNLVSNRGFIYDKVSFNYSLVPSTDKSTLSEIIKSVGTSKNFFVSIFPENSDGDEEHDFMLYGKRSNSALTYKAFTFYDHSMEITSW